MNEQIMRKDKRFVTVAAYQRISGLSYQTVMHMVKTGQIRHIKTEGGHYKIDTYTDDNNDIAILTKAINETQQLVKALCKQFNTATT